MSGTTPYPEPVEGYGAEICTLPFIKNPDFHKALPLFINFALMKRALRLYVFLVLFAGLSSCKVNYSFTGASIPPEVKTVSIHFFKNIAPLIKSNLSQQFTEALKDRFSAQTSLNQVTNGGDLDLAGEITGYATSPIAIQGNETAAMNRLTMTINVRFTNKFNDTQNFETSFSRYQDYPSSQSLASVEETIVKQIIEYLVDDIFNKTLVNW
jgi:outer membrane lipopolysaccharide assembly protein LptE/RlpB